MMRGSHAFSDDDGPTTGFIECLDNFLLDNFHLDDHHNDQGDQEDDWNIRHRTTGMADVDIPHHDRKKLIICPDELIMQGVPSSLSMDVEIRCVQIDMNSEEDNDIEDEEEDDDEEEEDMTVQILALLATTYGYKYVIQRLEANPDLIVQTMNKLGDTALHIAARSGNEEMVKHLVRFITTKKKKNKEGLRLISLSEPNLNRNTPLHLALQQGHQNVAFYLIRKKPHVAYKFNMYGVSPLYLAVKAGYLGLIVHLFIELPPRNLSTSTRNKLLQDRRAPVMHAAIEAHQIEILQVLSTTLPFLIESKNKEGQTPISYAAYKGYHEEVSYLLSEFPDITKIPDDDGTYPIHKAVFGDHVTVAESS